MSDSANLRFVRAARRVVSSFDIAGSAMSVGFLAWLTSKAAGEAAPKADAPDSSNDKPDATTHELPAVTSHASKSGGTTDVTATISEDGSHATTADPIAGRADSNDAQSKPATNGKANGKGPDGTVASVGSSTNPAILFADQATDATPGVSIVLAPVPDTKTPSELGGGNDNDAWIQAPHKNNNSSGAVAPDLAVVVGNGNGSTNDNSPVISSDGGGATAAVSVAEDTTAVTSVAATDADAGATLTYSIVGGADAAKFTINAVTGVLAFVSAPDFETPADAGADNVYDVQVQVSDGANTDVQDIAVTVTGVSSNPPIITSGGGGATAAVSAAENSTAITTVTAIDADAGAALTYSIVGGADAAKFTINASTGVLEFVSAPDAESPTDIGGNNVYDVQVQVSDGTNTDIQDIAVTVTNVNDNAPVITSNGGAATAALNVAENGTTIATVTATDADTGAALIYSIAGGADAAKFTINATTGVLQLVSAPDFESPTDAGGNNVYDVQVQVSDGTNTDVQDIAVTVTGLNDNTPVISSSGGGATAAVNVVENSTAVTTVTASDADAGAALTYSIVGGADAAKFTINATTGVLAFVSAADAEGATDAGGNNVYDVQVQVSDGTNTDAQDIAVTVTNVNDNTPVVTSNGGGATAAANVAENSTAVTTVTASDADAGATLTYSIVGGTDAAKFTINATTGVLEFVSAPDAEVPTDAGGNNVYDVQVQVSDGTNTDVQDIAVTVTNSNDNAPVISSNGGGATAAVNVAENGTAVTTVTATDADAGATLTYSIVGGADAGKFTINATTGALEFVSAPDTEAPTDAGGNNVHDVQVQVSDGTNTDVQDIAVTVTNVNDNTPAITSNGGGAAAAVNVAENSTSVITVTATDADAGATLTYSIVGGVDAAKFTINASTGVLEFASAPDAEIPTNAGGNNAYDVQVQVSDGTNTDVQDVAVTVTNVNDNTPAITSNGAGATAAVNITENSTAVTTVTATDADAGATLTYSIVGGADAAKFTINAATGALEFVSAPDAEAPTDAGGNNAYDVQVQVSDGTNTDVQDIAITVINASDNAPVITSNGGGSTASVNVAENNTTVTTVTATDADAGATLTYSIVGGADAAKFAINATTGVLELVSAPDAEAPTDAGGNNVYDVQVQVSDGTNTDVQDIAITVTGVNDNAPVITSNGGAATAAVNVAENTTAVTTVTAADADAAATAIYSVVGGADAAKFAINASTGVLEFVSAPDAEVPTDAGGNNVYDVQVQVSDGTNTDVQDIAVTVINASDNAPVITSNGGGSTASVNVAENNTTVTTVTATDADAGATLTYSIVGGADAAKFAINATTGVLEFVSAPDAEAPTDAGGNNVYDVQVQVSDGANTDTQNIAVTVTNVNDNTPVITSNSGAATAAVNVAENNTAVTTVTATDADAGAALTYSIVGGADAAKFTINATTGVLEFVSAPDAEAPTDVGGNNVYDVQVQVSDGTNTDVQDIAVTVTNVNDNAPVVTSNGGAATAAVNVAENSTAVTTVTATDADAGATLTYSIVGGADAAKFTINATTGALEFVSAPDAEAPTDTGGNNVYEVQVQVSDGTNTDVQDIAVTVTNVNDNTPVVTSDGGAATAAVNVTENSTAVSTVTASDADAGATLTYSIVGGADAAKFTINATTGALEFVSAPDAEAPTDTGGNNVYDVQVQVSDGTNTDVQDIAVTVTGVNDNIPVITSNGGAATAAVNVAENTTAVTTVTATDADAGATLTYSIVGGADAAKFTINASTGVLEFVSAPDAEAPTDAGGNNVYDVQVQVSDGSNSDIQDIAVTVTNVNDNTPAITSNGGGATTAVNVAENSTAVTTVTASDADAGATLTYSIVGGADAAKFTINAATGVLELVSAPDAEAPTDAGGNNVYDVQVQVSDGTNTDTQDIAVTVTGVNDNTPAITSNGGAATAAVNVAENGTTVTTVTATDADAGATLTYSIVGGADAAKFTINATTGELAFVSAPDAETPTDAGGNNVYDVQVQVSDGINTDVQNIAVTVTNVNDNTPAITSNGGAATAALSVAENSTAVTTVTASDADVGATLTYSITGGADAAKFTINATTGVLEFVSAPDAEAPTDAGGNNVYDVQVQVSDGTNADTQDVAVTVTNVNDNTPVITSNGGGATSAVNMAENSTTVTTVTAMDADAGATLTYSIVGGADAAKFTINATTGVLEFVSTPDAEAPTDAGGNNVYDVQVQVSDGTNTDVQDIAVTATNVNDNTPAITSNGGGAATAVNVAENGTAVTTVTATDADAGATLAYSIVGGADAAKFTINATTGVLQFISAPDFEGPTDAGGNNVYDVQVQVSDGTNTDVQAIAVTVTGANDNSPVISSNGGGATAAVNVAENTTAVTTVTATDADAGATLSYSIVGGADAAKFTINATTGVLEFVSAPDAEVPIDAGGNNVYDVQVQVSDGTNTDVQDIAVTVTNVNDNTPVIGSNGGGATAAVNVPENSTAVTTVTASDADTDATLTYSIVGGADAAKFTINASTGVLEFASAPDAETPTDAGGNNVYDVQVRVSDGTSTDVQDIAVTVTGVNDNTPVITSNGGGATAAVNVGENNTAVTTVTATDADAGATLTYSIVGGADAAKFAINGSTGALAFVSAPDFEVPTDAGGNNVYDVQVQVSDGSNTDIQDIAVTVVNASDNTPIITSNGGGATAAVNVAENGTAVTTVTATDADVGATLTYSIVGGADAAKFTINATTGVLEFVSAPDAEIPTDAGGNNVYDVQVQVSDGSNTDIQDIAVTVTNVNDNTPAITSNGGGATAAVNVAENSTAVTTVTATDADAGATLTYSIVGGADAAKFTINATTGVLEFVSAPDAETPTDAGGNNVYDVQVQVSDGTNTDVQDIAVTVTNVNDNTPVVSSNGGAATAAVNVAENTTVVTTVTATDADAGATLTYSITGGADAAKFAINATTGALTFVSAPDAEGPTDAGGNNVYDVEVQVSDGANTDVQDIAVTVTGVNDNTPVISSNGGGVTAAVNVAENSTAVTTVAASDADAGATLTYSIVGGADAAKFTINATTGVLEFISAPDAEALTDAGGNNVYDVQVQVSDGTNTDVQDIAVTVTNVNDNTPAITSNGGGATAAVNVAENSAAVTTVTALDADAGATLTYSIVGGADAAKFTVNATTGVLQFVSAPDFESPTDAGGNNVYDVQVQVSDGTNTDVQDIAVTVANVNDNTPVTTSNGGAATAAVNVAENGTTVTTVTATDADAGATLTYSIVGGADAAKFTVNATTGVLQFVSAPDFEAPTDAGGNNVYDVQVQVSDGTNTDVQDIAVTVTGVNDNTPVVSSNGGGATAAVNVAENTTVATAVAATDADAGATLTYSIVGGADAAKFTISATTGVLEFVSAPDFEAPADAGGNNVYDVQVQVSDGTNTDVQDIAVTVTNVNDNTPVMTSNGGGATAAVNVAENTTAVTTVIATDADAGATLTYSIVGGADVAKFAINGTTGALTFVSAPDAESPTDAGGNNVYDVQVQVSDGTNTDTQDIAVTVTGLNDNNPVITSNGGAATAAVNVAENGTTVTTVTATDADAGATLTYSIVGGADAAKFTINATTGELAFVSAPDAETPTDAGGNNVYDVQVQVSDGTNTDVQDIAVAVTGVNDNTPVITFNGGAATAAVNVSENATAVTTVTATDADSGATLTYSIVGGADAAKFTINATTGVLEFVSAPDAETPTDVGGNNVYDVQVQVSDGTNTDVQDIAVTVTDVNDNTPIITSNGGGATAAVNVAENSTAVTTVAATDADAGVALTYSIVGGADAAKFTINATTGALEFVSAPDAEAPTDAGGNNVYDVQVQVSDGANTDVQDIAVTVTNVNDNTPVITSNGGGATADVNVAENSTAVATVTATDADAGATLTYSIVGGADAAKFTINATTGVLEFVSAPDAETPTDAGGNNVYDVQVRVSDGTNTDVQDIAVTVTNVNDNTPVVTSNGGGAAAAVNVAENSTTVTTVTATDADAGATLTYSIAGGADAAKFTINASTGLLEFVSAPDFEAPTDAGGNNVYDVQVQVSDGTNTDVQDIAVTVTNVNDNTPVVTSNGGGATASVNVAENSTAVTTVTALDADAGATLTYSIVGGADAAKFTINASTGLLEVVSVPDFESPTDAGGNNVYDVQVQVSDGTNTDIQDIAVTVTNVNDNTPVITSNGGAATAAVNVAENGTTVTTVTATDADAGATLTYSIVSGADAAKFTINATTGELEFVSAPDAEAPTDAGGNNVYDVQVQVSDGTNTDVQDIAVTVTNLNDNTPVITSNGGAATAAVNVAENGTTVTTVTATDADAGATLTYSIVGGADAAKFAINASTGVLTFVSAPDAESPTDAGGNNVYDVQVQVSDGTNTDVQDIAVTVTNVNDNAPVITSNGGGATAAVNVAENGTAVTTVTATDADAGATLAYSIVGGADAAKFTINTSTGLLEFVSAPDAETPTDVGGNNVYDVQVQVSDGTNTDVQDIAVTVTNVNDDAPVIISNGGGATAAVNVAENTTAVTTVIATDADAGATLTYSIVGGADAAKFSINGSTGVLSFASAPDAETPTDAGGNNVYDVQVQVSDGTNTDVQDIAVTVTNVNDNTPVISSNGGGATAAVNVAENSTAVTTVTATDADAGATLTYSITGGADAAKFAINASTGVLTFVSAADAEAPTDAGGNSVYDVQVQASDGTNTDVQDIAVTVTNVNDNTPVITSNGGGATAAVNVAENSTAVTTVTATDADAGATPTYSIVGGADAAKFAINASTGALTFVSAPDAEAPTDVGGNNVYDVQVQVSDGTNTDVQDIAVTVTNVNDNTPAITSNGGGATASVNVAENTTAVTTITATDADAGATLTYSIVGGADAAKFTVNASTGALSFVSAPDAESPTDAGGNNVYDVQVQVSDGTNTDVQDIAITVTNVDDNTPVITSNGGGSTAAVTAAENTTAVTTVTATDADAGATLTYGITGGADAAKFTINSTTGVLSFVSAPDAESPTDVGGNNVYDVQVQVSDGTNTDVQDIAVTVTSVNDNTPVITSNGGGSTASVNVAENGTTVTTVTATDADAGATLTYSIAGGADAAKFAINGSTGALTFVSAPDAESPTDAGGNNVYDVQVQVSDGTNTDVQDIAVTVTNVNDNTPVITSNGGGSTAAVNVTENTTAVTTVTATDADAGATLTFSIVGGADAAKFAINGSTGALTFVSAPDAESPTDAGGNNVYDVQVQVSDGTNTDVQGIAVTVTNVNDNTPVISSNGGGATAAVNVAENSTAVTTVTATDADAGATLTYSIIGGADAAKFSINTSTGALSFVSAPDAEAPTDAGGNNVYDVQVQVSDGTNTDVQDIAVTVTNVNDNTPAITSNGGGSTAAVNIAENSTAVTTVTATDVDAGATLTYSITGGADAAKFTINGSTGALTFVSAPDAESPTDAGGNNIYDVQVQVSDGTNTDVQDIAVTVTNVNDNTPAISSNGGGATAAVNVVENSTAVTTVTATDADAGATLTYSIVGGADAAKFAINGSTGALTFVSAPDAESPTDAGGNNVYDVQVQVSDGTNTDIQDIAVTVTNANDNAPVITSNGGAATAAVNVAENSTAVTTVTATDADAGATLTYSITGGADAAKFAINGSTGALTFVSAPDAETPTDAGGNNVYDVQVQVSDGTSTDVQDIAVTVTNVNDNTPVITSNGGAATASVNVAENTTAVTTVTATDADAGATLTYSIVGGADAAKFTINGSTGALTFVSAPDAESPTDAGGNNVYDVQVQVSDGTNTDVQDIAVTVTNVNDNTPVITSNGGAATASVNVAENGTAVTTVTATDADAGATLTYSITGGADAAKFTINGSTGALTFVSAPDAETPTDAGGNNVYDVQVQVSDGTNTDTQDIAVTVTNVNDNTPVITSNGGAATAAANVAENSTTVTTVTATDADAGATLTYSIVGGADAARFTINGSTGLLEFVSAPDFEGPTDAGGNNVYDVQVQVSDGTNTDIQDIAVTITNVSGTYNGTAGDDTITGSSEEDTITGLGGNDTLTGGLGADVITGGTGVDTFIIGAVAELVAGDTINGTTEAGTIDTLRLDAAGTYNLSTFTTITNIDAIALNVDAAGFNLTVADSQVSTADANGDGTQNDLQISAAVAMTNGVTINASGLTGTNRITVVGTNLGGADTVTGGAGADTIDGGAGIDTITGGAGIDAITGGAGADILTGGTGADIFVVGAAADLAAGETIDGTSETGTTDTLRLDAAGTYDFSGFTTITNIDAIEFNVNASGFDVTVVDSQVSTADANGDGTKNDLRFGAAVAMTNGVTINASGLTGLNRIFVVGTNLAGVDIITGGAATDTIDAGAGADTITGGAGTDVMTGGTGADTFVIGAVADLAAGETIDGTAEAGTIDTLRLDAAGTYNLSGFSTITNIDAIAFNVNASGFNLTVADSQVSTADANGDGTQNDLQIGASVAMTNGVTVNASGLTGLNFITVVGTNLGGADTITGGAGVDTIDGGAGADVITGGAGADILTGGLGADTFVIGAVSDLASGETINGTAEAGTTDTLQLDAAGTYNLSTFTTITNIDAIALNVNAAGFNLTVADSQVSTADANGDGTQNDLQISAAVAMTNGVTIDASGLTGTNRIVVVGINLGGADTITGGAGVDTIDGGAGIDTITGGAGADVLTGGLGADTFVVGAVSDLAAGEAVNGTAEAGTIDTLRLDAAGTYDLSGFTTITNTDAIVLNVDAAGFDLTVADSQVSTADANGDSTQNDLQISAAVAMTNGVTIDASGLTGTNRISVVGTNLGGADTITGGAGIDTIDGGAGADTIDGGAGVDVLTGGLGADTFVIGAVADLAAGETINGASEAGTIDTLQLDAAGTYNLSGFTTITNIDAITFNVNASGFNLTVADSQVSTADANGDGTQNDLEISASVAMTNGVTISASGLTGINRITVVGTNLGGADTITGGAGADTIAGGTGNDSLSGGAGNDTYNFGLSDGTDTITESGVGTADSIVILASGADLTTLDFSDSSTTAASGNLVISYNGQQITVTNHFVGGNNVVETLTFSGGATYAGFSLGTGAYTLSTDDSSPRASTAGVDTILAGSSATETLTGNTGNDLIFGGAGVDTINSGDGTNLLVGGAGNDIMTGGTGTDWLVGGTNTDTLAGAAGNDTYVFGLADGTDTINESGVGTADTIVIQANGAALTTLDFTDSSTTAATGNLVIAYNGQTITVTSHFVGTTGVVETLSFSGGATYAGYSLGTGTYTISIDDNGARTATAGVDTILAGASGAETLTGNTGNDVISGGGGIDTINGGDGSDLLIGDAGNDNITGGIGDDWLVGGAGTDTLTGGTGADHFVFLATTNGTDTIADFSSAQVDLIDILVSAFGGGLTTGTDPATVFASSTTSTFSSASERFHYNTATGTLLYDADGNGAGAAVTLATFTGLPALTAADLHFI